MNCSRTVKNFCPIVGILEHFKSSSCPVLDHLFLDCTRKVQEVMFLKFSRTVSRANVPNCS